MIEQLETVELERARQANTVLAYRRFLEEFPNGDESLVAQSLIEELRFAEAKKAGTGQAWEIFIEEYPRGKHTTEARLALGAIEIEQALSSSDLPLVHRTLARFPDHPKRDSLVSHEDDLAWNEAQKKGDNESLSAYLNTHASGQHRVEAYRARERNDERDIQESEDLGRAEARAQRADAGERQRALVAEVQLQRATRTLDFDALRSLAHTESKEPAVQAVYARAKALLTSLERHPLTKALKNAVRDSRPGAGLPPHDTVVAAIFNGDPVDRVAALRELVEWGDPDDLKTFLSALDSEYVSVQLAAVRALSELAQALKPAVWHAVERAREDDILTRELNVSIWRQSAALREADGRATDALTAWREVTNLDVNNVTARARIFVLTQNAGDRIALGSTARDLANSVIQFAEGRWQPPAPNDVPDRPPPGKGRVFGLAGGTTVLRQICAAMDLGQDAISALGSLTVGVGPQEQELLTIAKADAERALSRIRMKRTELEESLHRDQAGFVPCGTDPATSIIVESRKIRSQAIAELGRSKDVRLLPFVEGLAFTNAAEVRAAAVTSAGALRATTVATHE